MFFEYFKFIGTGSDLTDFDQMIAATLPFALDSYIGKPTSTARVEIELAVLIGKPDFIPEGDNRTAFNGYYSATKDDRLIIEIKFYPFSNHLPLGEEVPQNTNTYMLLRKLLKSDYIWLTRPDAPRVALPRWQDFDNFPLVAGLLPAMLEPEPIESSMVEDEAETDVSMTFKSRERNTNG